jgi:hypothetical protein
MARYSVGAHLNRQPSQPRSIWRLGKDRTTAAAIKLWLNDKIKRYGLMLELKLDTKNKTVFCSLQLRGESSPVEIRVQQYELLEQGPTGFVVRLDGKKVETSREWLTRMIQDHLGERDLPIPEKLGWIAKNLFG